MLGRLGVATDSEAAATALPRTADSARWRWSTLAPRSASLAVLVASRFPIARLRRRSSGGRPLVPAVRLTTTTVRVSVSDAPRCALPSGPWSAMPVAEPARSRVIVPDGGSGCFLLSRTPTLHRSPLHARTWGGARRARVFPLHASCRSPERCHAGPCALHVCACTAALMTAGAADDCGCVCDMRCSQHAPPARALARSSIACDPLVRSRGFA
jgi:hypothetical protein